MPVGPASGRDNADVLEVTRLLVEARDGGRENFDRLIGAVYAHLRRIAQQQLRRERPGHTLHPTALVHEAYLKLSSDADLNVNDRDHFFAVAARAMRQILIDHARHRNAEKHGGEWVHTSFDGKQIAAGGADADLVALDSALDRLGQMDERARQIVEYRFFVGLSEQEIAELLGLSERTVRREWVKARAWLHKEVYGTSSEP
ncbi:MAG TPA: sigma-70 family RNA polymerase sigma factor [Terriglobales bacterium]|nr:sigma-70 family RNA polymerase sigma factor [Terriglobales bacterium]